MQAETKIPKTTGLEALRQKVKLSLNLPQTQTKIKESIEMPYKQPASTKSQSQKSSDSSEPDKKTFQQRYTIDSTLGQGAHGVVKICRSKQKNLKFAVKIMKLDEQISYMNRKNFLTMKCLRHQNIIRYRALYLDEAKRICYLVMDYIDYPQLKGLKVQNESQLKQITLQILKALVYMHKKHICHRDLKTQNILFCRETGKLKIIDFGICKQMTIRQEKSQMLTPTGTLIYKAPEMFEGGGYDEKIDLWALGVIMYELVTGRNPFLSEYMADTIKNIQTLDVDFKEEVWGNYSKICIDLIAHLLKRDKKERLSAEQTIKHLFFTEKNEDGMNFSHRHHRQKTQKKIAQQYLMTYIIPKTKPNPNKVQIDPVSKKQSLIANFVESQQQDDGINIY